jgi:HEAT repeat protein
LVAAIALVEAAERGPVREALTERLARMTPATLKSRLADEEPEYRLAAVRALAWRQERAAVPWLIPLLDDPEPVVVQTAHWALKALTKQDHGPAADADRADRVLSMVAWQAWWKKEGEVAQNTPGS